MSFGNRYADAQRKETLKMLKSLVKGIENGTLIVESKGYWRAATIGKYIYRVDVINPKESEVLPEKDE